METHAFFLRLMFILLTARLFAEVAVRLGVPAVIGELLAGILLGPSLLGWLEPGETFKLLAEIGIILLLVEVGLGTDVQRLLHPGGKSSIVALAGFMLPFALGFGLSYGLLGLSLLPALFMGGTLTATSIGVTVRVLVDLRRNSSQEGQIVLGAAVLDDILGVVLLGGFAAGLAPSRRFFSSPGHGHSHGQAFCQGRRTPDAASRTPVHAHLLCHGGSVAEPARD